MRKPPPHPASSLIHSPPCEFTGQTLWATKPLPPESLQGLTTGWAVQGSSQSLPSILGHPLSHPNFPTTFFPSSLPLHTGCLTFSAQWPYCTQQKVASIPVFTEHFLPVLQLFSESCLFRYVSVYVIYVPSSAQGLGTLIFESFPWSPPFLLWVCPSTQSMLCKLTHTEDNFKNFFPQVYTNHTSECSENL